MDCLESVEIAPRKMLKIIEKTISKACCFTIVPEIFWGTEKMRALAIKKQGLGERYSPNATEGTASGFHKKDWLTIRFITPLSEAT
jgi:hypothetical protein